jgi:transposase
VADLLTRYPTPVALKTAGRGHVRARLKKHAPRAAERFTGAVFNALGEQTVVVVGTNAAGIVLPKLAEQLLSLRHQRDAIAAQVETLVEAHPLHKVLTSMPGIGVRTCARILTEATGKHFASAAHLASYADIAPVTRRSVTSTRGEHTSRHGNKKLKRALFLSAFAALHYPPSRAYYDRKRAEGKRHNQAPHRPRTPPFRRPLRHAPRRNPLPGPGTTKPTRSGLTKTIEAPPPFDRLTG